MTDFCCFNGSSGGNDSGDGSNGLDVGVGGVGGLGGVDGIKGVVGGVDWGVEGGVNGVAGGVAGGVNGVAGGVNGVGVAGVAGGVNGVAVDGVSGVAGGNFGCVSSWGSFNGWGGGDLFKVIPGGSPGIGGTVGGLLLEVGPRGNAAIAVGGSITNSESNVPFTEYFFNIL